MWIRSLVFENLGALFCEGKAPLGVSEGWVSEGSLASFPPSPLPHPPTPHPILSKLGAAFGRLQ